MSLGLEMEWAEAFRTFWPHNSPSKSCCPAPRTGRRILTFWGLHHGQLSLVSLWLACGAWNLFWDPQGDCLGRCDAFLSCDFGLPRTGSSLAVHSSSLDSLHSSSGTSSSSAWALGLKWNGLKPLEPSGPTIAPQNHATRLLGWGGGF